jgi:hypothetical protein
MLYCFGYCDKLYTCILPPPTAETGRQHISIFSTKTANLQCFSSTICYKKETVNMTDFHIVTQPLDKKTMQEYINNFRRRIAKLLKPGIGLACNIYPAEKGGAILEFTIGPGIENDDNYMGNSPTVSYALSKVKQRAFGGNLSGFVFGGTNVMLEDNRIILIKDDSRSQWSDSAAQQDVDRILQGPQRVQQ